MTLFKLGDITRKVALRKGWDDSYAADVEREYLRFIRLHTSNPGVPVSPSDDIDEVWHEHILNTRAYTEFCAKEFGGYMHHDPVGLGEELHDLSPTLELYKSTYGEDAPERIWLGDAACRGRCHLKCEIKAGQCGGKCNVKA